MNKQQLASRIWQSANKMRSKIAASEYKDYILGFIFYKFLSDAELKFLRKEGASEDEIKALREPDPDNPDENDESRLATIKMVQQELGYFISYNYLFSTWLQKGAAFQEKNVVDALLAFARLISPTHKKVFENIFDTLSAGLSKLGESAPARTKAIAGLLKLIKDIPMDSKQDYDVLGFIYEYLLANFAANAGKAGEFYTPFEVSQFMSEIVANHLKGKREIAIYDPTSGSGSLLINIGRSVARHIDNEDNIKYFAQELIGSTYNLTRMNLVMRGVLPDNIVVRNADTLEDDWPRDFEETNKPLHVDAVVSNPPYSQPWSPEGKDNDPRYKNFGLAPKSKADLAFLLHDLFHLKTDGIMTIVLPHGVLFRGDPEGADGEGAIRKNLIERNHIDAIIGLPQNIFFGTGIATIVMVLRQHRENDDILFIDASRDFVKAGSKNKLKTSDEKKIVVTFIGRIETDPKYSRRVSRDEIRANGYNLNIPRYVDSADAPEQWDIYATMFGGIPKTELVDMTKVWEAFPTLQSELFEGNGSPYLKLKTADIRATIVNNSEIKNFVGNFSAKFATLASFLKSQLIDNLTTLVPVKQEGILSGDIFARLKDIPLINKYKAYQALSDEWVSISGDFEIIQSEGVESIKVVDPTYKPSKEKDGEETDPVQDGWEGRILPFSLIQSIFLKAEADALKAKEARLADITASLSELIENFTDEEKSGEYKDALNDNGDDFKTAELVRIVKTLAKTNANYLEESVEAKLIQANDLLTESKAVKAVIKKLSTELIIKTKVTIESLTDGQALVLLTRKWVDPIVAAMDNLPQEIIKNITAKVKALADKYATTYTEVASKITAAEDAIVNLIDDLTGDEFDMAGLAEFKKIIKGDRE